MIPPHAHDPCLHLRGNFAEALRQHDVFRWLLRAELGLPPSQHFRKLIAPLLGRPLDGGHGGEALFQQA